MICDSQASESARSTLFGMRPEKRPVDLRDARLSTNICRGSINSWSVFGRLLRKLWSINATQLITIYLVSSVFRPLDTFSGGPSTCLGPCRFIGYA